MGRKKRLLILFAVLFLVFSATPGYSSEKPSCAVLLFHPDTASSSIYQSQLISGQYAQLLNRLDMFDVMDFKKIDDVLTQKNAADTEKSCTDLGCALKIGNRLGVDFVIYGIIGNVGNLYSLDTTLVNVAGGNETQHALYDFQGTEAEFTKNAASENIKSLFGIYEIPGAAEIISPPAPLPAAADSPATAAAVEPAPSTMEEPEKSIFVGPRIGIGASNDGIEFGGGLEVQVSHLSFIAMLNGDGYAGGISYYLHTKGNSPFLALSGTYYDTENNGVDEIGRIYGVLLGYRITLDNYVDKDFASHINARIGVGAGYVNWDQTEPNRDNEQDNDEEIIPIFELTLGYLF